MSSGFGIFNLCMRHNTKSRVILMYYMYDKTMFPLKKKGMENKNNNNDKFFFVELSYIIFVYACTIIIRHL